MTALAPKSCPLLDGTQSTKQLLQKIKAAAVNTGFSLSSARIDFGLLDNGTPENVE